VFRSCGLERVEAHGLLSVFLLSDPRRGRDEIAAWLGEKLGFIVGDEERSRVILERGGMEEPLIEEYHRLIREHLRRLVEDPELISKTHELETVGRIVTVGFKP